MDGLSIGILLVCGSLRAGSTNAALLRTAREVAPDGVTTDFYLQLAELPHFDPDDDQEGQPVHPAVAQLRSRIRAADAVLFSTPEYAGALPGSFKNLLDWTVGGGETYGKPVAWVNACVQISVSRDAVGTDGLIAEPTIREGAKDVLTSLAEHVAAERESP